MVPTSYRDLGNTTIRSNQYSVTEFYVPTPGDTGKAGGPGGKRPHVQPGRTMPGVWFYYDMHAIKVDIVEQQRHFLAFLTNLCAIVGGVWAVSGVLDGAVYTGQRIIRQKQQLGKFT